MSTEQLGETLDNIESRAQKSEGKCTNKSEK